MTSRAKARVTFALWLGLALAVLVLAFLNRPLTGGNLRSLDSIDFVFVLANVAFAFISAIVGAVVASRTRHRIGWLLLAFALTILVPAAGEQYAFYGLVTARGSLPAAKVQVGRPTGASHSSCRRWCSSSCSSRREGRGAPGGGRSS